MDRRLTTIRRGRLQVAAALLASLAPAVVSAQSFGYITMTPPVLAAGGPASALLTAQVTGAPTRVTLVFDPGPSGAPVNADLRDDGTGGDAVAGDGLYSITLPTAPIIGALRADDVNRVFTGYLDVFNGATRVVRLNLFSDVYSASAGSWPALALAPNVQATSRLVNIVMPASFFAAPGAGPVAREFYRWFRDDYDFLNIIYSPWKPANRQHFATRNDVAGVGLSVFNNDLTYGSAGRLLGISEFPIPMFFDGADQGYVHELGHQWINFLNFPPLAQGMPHWPYSSMGTGVMGISIGGAGGQGGNFPCEVVDSGGVVRLNPRTTPPGYNDVDLYLMGVLPASQVRQQVVFNDQAAAQAAPCTGQIYPGAVTRLNASDIVAQVGARVPAAGDAPTRFRVATILVTRDVPASPDALSLYSWLADRAAGQAAAATHVGLVKLQGLPFYAATGGRASLDVALSLDAPLAPADFRATAINGNTVTFAWTAAAGAVAPTSYVIEGGLTPGSVLGSLPIAGTPTTFTAALPTGRFYVRLHAVAGPVRSPASNEIAIAVNVPEPPGAPGSLLGLVNGSSLALAWDNAPAGGAVTSLALDVMGSITASLPLPLTDAFAFNGVPPGTYTLAVRALNASGSSPPSNAVTLSFPGPCSGSPQTPAAFGLTRSGNVVTAAWSLPASGPAPTSYVLSVTGAFTGSIPTTSRLLSGAVGAGTYIVRVAATNACGSSAPTAPATIVVP